MKEEVRPTVSLSPNSVANQTYQRLVSLYLTSSSKAVSWVYMVMI